MTSSTQQLPLHTTLLSAVMTPNSKALLAVIPFRFCHLPLCQAQKSKPQTATTNASTPREPLPKQAYKPTTT